MKAQTSPGGKLRTGSPETEPREEERARARSGNGDKVPVVYQGLSGPEGPGHWGVRPRTDFFGKKKL